MSLLRMAILVLLAGVAAAGYWWFNLPAGPYKPDNGGLYPIKADGKYGYMDRSGKTAIRPQFDAAGRFSEGLAAVGFGTKLGYINTKGAVVITPQFDNTEVPGGFPLFLFEFRYGRARVVQGGSFGIIGMDGKFVRSPDLAWADPFSEGLAHVRTPNGATFFVDRTGKPVAMSNAFESTEEFAGGLAPASSGGKWGFIDVAGRWVIDPQFEGAASFGDGVAPVVVGGRTGYVDRQGKFVINPQFDVGLRFSEGRAGIRLADKWGFIDGKGSVLVMPQYLEAGGFSSGLAPVRTAEGWGYIDTTGKTLISPQFDSADQFRNGLAQVAALGKEGYIDTKGAFVVDPFPGTTVLAERARIVSEAAQAAERAKEAERVAAEAKAAEQQKIASAIERQDAELKQNIANARNILVGSWKDENSLSIYKSDGTLETRWDSGEVRSGDWRVQGDVILHNYTRIKGSDGQWRNQSTSSSSKLIYIDDNVLRVLQNGTTWNNRRVSRD